MNLFLSLQYDPHDTNKELLPIELSWTRQLRQYKHVLSRVFQPRGRFLHCSDVLVFYKALLLASEFPTLSSVFHLMFKILHHLVQSIKDHVIVWHYRALGFSIAHFCFSLRLDASDMCFQISGQNSSSLEVVCFLVSLSPDNVHPSGGFSFNILILSNSHQYFSPTIHRVMYVCFW